MCSCEPLGFPLRWRQFQTVIQTPDRQPRVCSPVLCGVILLCVWQERMQMNDGSTFESPDKEKRNADQQERYCFKSESANLDMCSITYVFSPSPLCVFVCVCRSACVSGILKKRQILQDYLDLHRDLICLIVKIVLATGTFFLFFLFPH